MNISVISAQNILPLALENLELVFVNYTNNSSTSPQEAFKARNSGVEMASNEVVTFFDSQDSWSLQHVDLIEEHFSADVDFLLLTPKGLPLPYSVEKLLKYFANGEACPTGNIVARKQVFKKLNGFNATLPHSASWEFILRALLDKSISVRVVNEASWVYKYNPLSIANTRLPSHQEVIAWRRQWAQNI